MCARARAKELWRSLSFTAGQTAQRRRSYISAGMASGTIRASIYLRRAKTFGPPPSSRPPLYMVHIKRRDDDRAGEGGTRDSQCERYIEGHYVKTNRCIK